MAALLASLEINNAVTVPLLLSIPDVDERSVWLKLSNAAIVKFFLTK